MWKMVSIAVLSLTGSIAYICSQKSLFGSHYCASRDRLDGKVIIVTGANSGIGKETALILASKGAEVILACRNIVEGDRVVSEIKRKTHNLSVRCEKLDLSSFQSIIDFVNRFKLKGSKLYGLLNNAGIFHIPYQLTADGFDLTLQTNYLGPFLLTYLLLDVIKNSAPSRIVNVNSDAHNFLQSLDVSQVTRHYTDPEQYDKFMSYGTSKLCLMLFTTKLAKLLEDKQVIVTSVNPGNVRTNIHRHFPPIQDLPFWSFNKFLLWLTFKTPYEGAQTSVHMLTEPLHIVNGGYYSGCKQEKPSNLSQSSDLEDELWEATLEWLRPVLHTNGKL